MCYSKEFKEASISIFNHLHKEKYSCNEIKNIFKNEYKNFPSLSSIYVWIQEIYIDHKKMRKIINHIENIEIQILLKKLKHL